MKECGQIASHDDGESGDYYYCPQHASCDYPYGDSELLDAIAAREIADGSDADGPWGYEDAEECARLREKIDGQEVIKVDGIWVENMALKRRPLDDVKERMWLYKMMTGRSIPAELRIKQ